MSAICVVSYAFDPSTGEGYVYLPGRNDKTYRFNVHTIIRGVEGKWFHSWTKRDTVVQQLIESRLRLQRFAARGDEDPKNSRNQPHRVVETEPVIPRYATAPQK